jgi:hypothetical protein
MKIKINKIRKFFRKLPRVLISNSFLTILGVILLSLAIGGAVFYKYDFLAKKKEPEISPTSFKFQEKAYQDMLLKWQEREQIFDEADNKQYADPFGALSSTPG